ncbi:major strawberry allergen Fra a 1.07-like [Aristolochia californica]|uniref:major strawberry allergen Fra a 1.07-like n=1 Tax=Aristolochia californica TaxID=171875 RepID=UPI0035E30CF1
MVAGSFSQALVSPVSPARLWKASIDTHNLIPKLIPDQVASIVLLEGDGGVGSVTQFNFGEALKDLKYVKNRVIGMDNENYVFKFSLVEGGGVGTKLKSCTIESTMEATSAEGTKTTLKMDYDTLDDGPLSQEEAQTIVGGVLRQTKAIEGHLEANPDAYA